MLQEGQQVRVEAQHHQLQRSLRCLLPQAATDVWASRSWRESKWGADESGVRVVSLEQDD